MSTLSLRKIKHDSSAVDNITLDSSGNTSINKRLEIQQDSISDNRIILRGQPGSSYRYCIDNNSNLNVFRVFRENDADGASGVEYFKLDSAGRVTMPYQPAFSAGFDNNTGYTNFTGTMLWNNIISNVGSHYNATNGRFTAPVAGNYYFAWNCLSADNSLYAELNLNKNSTVIVRTQQDGGTNQIGGQIVIPLAVGDYVTIVATSNGTATVYLGGSGVTYNQFSGFLVG